MLSVRSPSGLQLPLGWLVDFPECLLSARGLTVQWLCIESRDDTEPKWDHQ